MPVDSLLQQARRACAANYRIIKDVGDMRYELVRPILVKIENPHQLRQLEIKCPQLVGHDAECWRAIIKRNVPGWEVRLQEPRNPDDWFKTFQDLKEQVQRESRESASLLQAEFALINENREHKMAQTKSTRELPRPTVPADVRQAYKTYTGDMRRLGAKRPETALDKIRKQAPSSKSSKMAVPTKDLKNRASTVLQAPRGFVEAARESMEASRLKKQPGAAISQPRIAAPPLMVTMTSTTARQTMQIREDRLRALTTGRIVPRRELEGVPCIDGTSTPSDPTEGLRQNSTDATAKAYSSARSPSSTGSVTTFISDGRRPSELERRRAAKITRRLRREATSRNGLDRMDENFISNQSQIASSITPPAVVRQLSSAKPPTPKLDWNEVPKLSSTTPQASRAAGDNDRKGPRLGISRSPSPISIPTKKRRADMDPFQPRKKPNLASATRSPTPPPLEDSLDDLF